MRTANAKRLGVIERHPHYITRRYAQFAASLLALHSGLDDLVVGIGGEEMLLNDLATLRVEARTEFFFVAFLAFRWIARTWSALLTLSGRSVCIAVWSKAA